MYDIYSERKKNVRENIKSILEDDVNINKTRDISPIGQGVAR